ncbi:MAG: MBL fold metallo-hydrolase [Mycobacteriaceae bacterium]|nr:MBL fold metallo-hydrolase [Mycobacteriaceae bacterium]
MSELHLAIDDGYTGHVTPGSDPQRRTVNGAQIIKMSVGPMDNNAYLIHCTESGRGVLIDAANEPRRLIRLIEEQGPGLDLVVTTHQHPDHWQALEEVAAATAAPTAAHPLDAGPLPIRPDVLLADGEPIHIGELRLSVIHLRGHTPGSVAVAFTDGDGRTHIFSGDALFPGGVGKTHTPESFATLLHDVESKLFAQYRDDTAVYPGHGDDTTLAAERPHLPEWRTRGW